MDTVVLARAQFAANITFHILFPSISIAVLLLFRLTYLRARMKTDGKLQEKAVAWSKIAWPLMVLGPILITMATPPVIVASGGFSCRVFRGKTIELRYA